MVKQKELKAVVFDEETSPAKGHFFGHKWETNIVKILEHETIITICYTEVGSDKIHSISQWDFPDWKKGVWNDKSLVKAFREILMKYDIIIGQNSDQFDIKMFNSRLAFWNLDPLPEYKTFDTKKIAKSKLKLPSYSLEDMATYFGFGGKYHHSGLDMWFDSRDGDTKAQKEMVHYCKIDVKRTEQVLGRILPFYKITNEYTRTNKAVDINCSNPLCLSANLIRNKRRRMVGGWKNQYQCKDCGKYTTDNKVIKDEEEE